jgi:hypothetical protein
LNGRPVGLQRERRWSRGSRDANINKRQNKKPRSKRGFSRSGLVDLNRASRRDDRLTCSAQIVG